MDAQALLKALLTQKLGELIVSQFTTPSSEGSEGRGNMMSNQPFTPSLIDILGGLNTMPLREQSVYEALTLYIEQHVVTLATARERRLQLARVFGPLGEKPIRSLRQSDLMTALDRIPGGTNRNRHRSASLHFIKWCRQRELTDLRPEVSRDREDSRDVVVPIEDIRTLYRVAEGLGDYRGFCRLLILTGQRKGDVRGIRPSHVSGQWWTQPTSKNGKSHRVWLPMVALAELQLGLHEDHASYRWTRRADFARLKHNWDDASGVTGWTLHDLRRSFATHMVEAGVREVVIDKTLNHAGGAPSAVARVYQRADLQAERQAAAEMWAGTVTGA